jgi:hypothetical protein
MDKSMIEDEFALDYFLRGRAVILFLSMKFLRMKFKLRQLSDLRGICLSRKYLYLVHVRARVCVHKSIFLVSGKKA